MHVRALAAVPNGQMHPINGAASLYAFACLAGLVPINTIYTYGRFWPL